MADIDDRRGTNERDAMRGDTTPTGRGSDWSTEESWWRENYRSRPYATADRGFEFHRPAYRYGFESAGRNGGRSWNEVEPELRGGWDRYEHRGDNRSTWEEVKDSVKDAWERVTGKNR